MYRQAAQRLLPYNKKNGIAAIGAKQLKGNDYPGFTGFPLPQWPLWQYSVMKNFIDFLKNQAIVMLADKLSKKYFK